MAIISPNPTQGTALLSGSQSWLQPDNALDPIVADSFVYNPLQFSATEKASYLDFFRAVAAQSNTMIPIVSSTGVTGAVATGATFNYITVTNTVAIVLTLPSVSAAKGNSYCFKKTSNNSYVATIYSASNIDGATGCTGLSGQYDAVTVWSDGSTYHISATAT